MSRRVVFRPAGVAGPVALDELGSDASGAWGIVDDAAWLAAGASGAALDLLYLSPTEYAHAVRGLRAEEIPTVVARQRASFTPEVPALAVGLVELSLRACFTALGDSTADAPARAELMMAVASFTAVPRYDGTALPRLLDFLREGEARLIAELDSPSLQRANDLDPGGREREVRRGFAVAVGQLLARRGQPEKAKVLPYFDVQRVCLFSPPPQDLVTWAHAFHEPSAELGGGLLMPAPERKFDELAARGHTIRVIYPTAGYLVDALSSLTPAQLEVELDERLRGSPEFWPYLTALRLEQAALRTAARLIGGADAEVVTLLVPQLQEEAARLGRWLAVGAPAAGGTPREALTETIETAAFLVAYCRQRGTLERTGGLAALGRALSHVADAWGK